MDLLELEMEESSSVDVVKEEAFIISAREREREMLGGVGLIPFERKTNHRPESALKQHL